MSPEIKEKIPEGRHWQDFATIDEYPDADSIVVWIFLSFKRSAGVIFGRH